MNQEAILAVLTDSKDDAKSLKEIAEEKWTWTSLPMSIGSA